MQIGSTSSPRATSRLAAAAQTSPSTRSRDAAASGSAAAAGLTGSAGSLLSYMTGQSVAPAATGAAALVSDDSLRSWARELSDGDRTMVETVTGSTIAEDGSFVDADGKPASLSPSQTAIVAALSLMRSEQSTAEAAQPVTAEQYDDLCNRAQVALFQAGNLFDPAVRQAGHDYLDAAASNAPSTEDDPRYSLDAVEKYVTHPLGLMVKLPVPSDGREGWVDPEVVQASYDRWMGYYKTVNAVHSHAKTLFEQGKAAGKAGDEIYADILREQVAQPDSYWQARDPDGISGNLKEKTQDELATLDAAIARRKG